MLKSHYLKSQLEFTATNLEKNNFETHFYGVMRLKVNFVFLQSFDPKQGGKATRTYDVKERENEKEWELENWDGLEKRLKKVSEGRIWQLTWDLNF